MLLCGFQQNVDFLREEFVRIRYCWNPFQGLSGFCSESTIGLQNCLFQQSVLRHERCTANLLFEQLLEITDSIRILSLLSKPCFRPVIKNEIVGIVGDQLFQDWKRRCVLLICEKCRVVDDTRFSPGISSPFHCSLELTDAQILVSSGAEKPAKWLDRRRQRSGEVIKAPNPT